MAKYFSKNLRHLRNIKKISQQELANKLQVDRSTISLWENDKIDITLDKALTCSEILNVPYPELFGKDLTLGTDEITQEDFTKEVLKLLDKTAMSEMDKGYLIQTIKMIGGNKNE